MTTKRVRGFSFAFWLIIDAAVLLHCGAVQARDLVFCIDKSSPSAAVDARLAQAVGTIRRTHVGVFYYSGLPKGDDKDNFDLREYKEMLAGSCDLVVGFPYDTRGGDLPAYLHATQPYASTGFVLVTPHRGRYTALADMPQGTHLAVAYNTLANYYFRNHSNLVADIVADDEDAMQSIARNEVTGALLWRPGVAEQIERHSPPPNVDLHPLDEPNSNWNLVALYGANGGEAASAFEAAIAALRNCGDLTKTLGFYADAAPLADRQRIAAKTPEPDGHAPASAKSSDCSSGKTPVPTLFTESQADAGKKLFLDKCALCHGPNLEGRAGPSLRGKLFLPAKAGHTVADIFRIVSQNMPATAPGSLAKGEYVEIMAFLLQQNGYPEGSRDLTFDLAIKAKTPMIYRGN